MSKRYSEKSFKDSSVMKKSKLTFKEKRKLKREKKFEEIADEFLERHFSLPMYIE